MKCTKCGNEFEGNFCDQCGAKADNSKDFSFLNGILVNQQEKILAVLGNRFAQNFISTGNLGMGFAILSDKRVYFKGNCLIRKGKGFYSKSEERTVDLKDVTGTGFVHNKAEWPFVLQWVAFALFCFAALVFVTYLFLTIFQELFIRPQHPSYWKGNDSYSLITFYTFFAMLLFCGLFFLFRMMRKSRTYTAFEISYAGGGIAFSLYWITDEEARGFQKQLVLLKQKMENEILDTSVDIVNGGEKQKLTVPEELRQYKDLLDMGIITQEEFENKKHELLYR